MNTLDLAWRNLLRNRRRSLLTLAAIAVGAAAVVIFGGYVAATIKAVRTETIRNSGHLTVAARGWLDFGRADAGRFALRDADAIVARLRADPVLAPMLAVVTPVLHVQGVAGNFAAGTSSNFIASGWRADERRQMLAWDDSGLRMPPLASALRADRPDSGTIGFGLAQLLGLCAALEVRDCLPLPPRDDAAAPAMGAELAALVARNAAEAPQAGVATDATAASAGQPATPPDPDVAIELLAAGTGGAPNIVRMRVDRVERNAMRELDMMQIALPLPLAERLVFGPDGHGASAIAVQLHRTADLPAARERIAALLADRAQPVEIHDFGTMNPQYGQIVGMFASLFGFVAVLMAVVTLFSVANAVNMAIGERIGEIGTLRAIGLRRAQIRRMFVLEGGLIGALGAVTGVVAATLIAEYGINHAGLTWTPPGRAQAVPIGVDAFGSPELLGLAVALLALLACVSSWWPARRAARLEIVEALRHV
ncbi:ABC transporter permease [Derxia lacustris]|uniref:ABC transporter permease n=1 Tax=Derxia lacustris TaxID=764842 RepID=UPI000A1705E6|nr:FtsX-like permease family protein [Derxia lacustris]